MDVRVFEAVEARSKGMCEAGTGCVNRAEHVHHALTKARGGRLLDVHASTSFDNGTFDPTVHLAHLVHLCERCHTLAHGNIRWAEKLGLMVRGYVTTGMDGTPRYVGAYPPLAEPFGEVPA